MIKNFNDLILFLYFSKQQINLTNDNLVADPLTISVPLLQQLTPIQAQEKFSEGVNDYVLMRLITLIKFELSKSLTTKGINFNRNDEISNLLKETKKIVGSDQLYILDIIDSLRCLRNSLEYRKGIIGERDLNTKNQLKIIYPTFELFFEEQDGKRTTVKTLPATGPKNAALKIQIIKTEIVYNIGDQCNIIPIDVLFCMTVLISSFFDEFNKKSNN